MFDDKKIETIQSNDNPSMVCFKNTRINKGVVDSLCSTSACYRKLLGGGGANIIIQQNCSHVNIETRRFEMIHIYEMKISVLYRFAGLLFQLNPNA